MELQLRRLVKNYRIDILAGVLDSTDGTGKGFPLRGNWLTCSPKEGVSAALQQVASCGFRVEIVPGSWFLVNSVNWLIGLFGVCLVAGCRLQVTGCGFQVAPRKGFALRVNWFLVPGSWLIG
jgi:hypothetical protein